MSFGSVLIVLSALLAAAAFASALAWNRGRPWGETTFRWSYHLMTGALALATVLLLAAILRHDFRYDYVIGYSSRDLPGLYLVSALWGGQEGTYLLWALFGALLGYGLFRKGAWRPGAVMTAYTPTIGILILFMLNRSGNPFRLAPVVPIDGRGLNPLLQDPWMATHPPVVFLGYAAMTVPAVLAWIAAFHHDDKGWVGPGLRWTLLGFVTLGAGIILGGVWAYKVLGWGGFWGWDPVENASLIPWIVGAALIHGLLVQQSTGALRRTNLVLAMTGYLLVMYSTFLTRSGVLADFSVHSFPKGTIYGWLVAALVGVLAVSVFALMRYRAAAANPMETRLAWPLVLTASIVLLSVSALLVLVGTSWPILSSLVGKPSTPTAPFYNEVNLPVYLCLLAVLGLGPFLSWAPLPASFWVRRFLAALLLAAAGTALAMALGGRGPAAIALFFLALLALSSNVIRFVEVARRRFLQAGAAVSHVGFALIFTGIVAAESWDRSVELALPLDQPASAFGRTLTFRGHVHGSEPKDRWGITVADAKGRTEEAAVTLYRLPDGQTFKKPSILRGLTHDFYLAPNALEGGGGSESAEGPALELAKNQPFPFRGAELTFLRFETGGNMAGEMVVNAILRVVKEGREETVALPLVAGGGRMEGTPVPVASLDGLALTLRGMSVERGTISVVSGGGGGAGAPQSLVLQASVKPMIGLLWAGTFLLAAGCILAFIRRTVDRRAAGAHAGLPAQSGPRLPRKERVA